jgi:putative ABC transport system permease protein
MENLRLSFQGIWAHKMRSFLTMLGIIIGIAAIITIVSTIKGTNEQIKENLVGAGDNVVHVELYNGDWTYTSGQGDSTPEGVPMVNDELKSMILDFDEVSQVSAYRTGYIMDGIYYQKNSVDGATMYGIDDTYFDTEGYMLTSGRDFTEDDRVNNKKMMIIDDTASEALFNGVDPIGKCVEMNGEVFTIVGVVAEEETFEPVISSIDDWYTYYYSDSSGKFFVPEGLWPMIYGFDEPYNVVVRASSTENMTSAGKKTADLLNTYIDGYTDSSDEEESSSVKYKSENLMEKAKSLQELANATSKQLIWIAGISLIVGGIGVMNIMLVSVTERTREIGLKKALGAKKSVILGQFLTEAAVLTSLGGIIGVGAGIGLAYIVADVASVPVAISGSAIVISVVFSMVIGIIFGFIPSVKAANLNPIDALRYE